MKSNNFLLRVLTSLSLIALLIIGLFFSSKSLVFLVSLFVAVLIWEYYGLVFYKKKALKTFLPFAVGIFGAYLFFASPWVYALLKWGSFSNSFPLKKTSFFISTSFLSWAMLLFYLWFVVCFWSFYFCLNTLIAGSKKNLSWVFSLLAWFYIAFPAGWFLNMFLQEKKTLYLILLIMVVFTGDIFAYLGGRCLKGKKWVPSLSPKKTWSGLFCGLSASGLVSGVGFFFLTGTASFFSFLAYFLFGTLGFFVAQTGDLFVSLLKRRAGVKDSGFLLPGHGGALDRLDGFLLAFPFMCFCMNIFI